MEKLQKGLPALRRLLEAVGFGLCQIDYTQDFSGVLVRPALVRYLVDIHGFFQQGDFAFPENGGCILDNTDSMGNHVCTFVQTRNGRTTSTKFYNKVVSQFEAGDVQETFGGHLAHYVDSTNKHLRRNFYNQSAKKGLHAGRDSAVCLGGGGSFQNCGGRAGGGGFGVGEHRRRPVCCSAANEAMGKHRALSGPMHGTRGPPARGDLCRLERPQQNQQGAGNARETDGGKGRRR